MDPALEIQDLHYTYPDGRVALQGITLAIRPGEKVALIGPNGAGKSTLLLHFNGLLTGQGRVSVCGAPLTPATLAAARARVGLVFQNPDDQLFSPTVFEDVAFGPVYQGLGGKEIEARVVQALEEVSMAEYARRVPYHLSTGEKKRIAIATVLSMRPEILALDEPTSGLDPRARRSLIRLLARLPQTLIAATHDLAFARELLPRTVILAEGKIAADGPTADLLSDRSLLEKHGLEP